MKNDVTGIGVPVTSRGRKSSPKGCKSHPKLGPLMQAVIGAAVGAGMKGGENQQQEAAADRAHLKETMSKQGWKR